MKQKLNIIERLVWGGGKSSYMFTVSVSFRGQISPDQLKEALTSLRKKNPLLCVRIALDEGKNPWFESEGVPGFSIRTLKRNSEADVLNEIKNELNMPINWKSGPLIRFMLLESPAITDLVISCHHCIADGISISCLIRDIFAFRMNPHQDISIVPESPNLYALLPNSVKKGIPNDKISENAEPITFVESTSLKAEYGLLKLDSPLCKGNLQFHAWEFTESQTTALLQRCHQEQVLHGRDGDSLRCRV